jgi:hypothetical protein
MRPGRAGVNKYGKGNGNVGVANGSKVELVTILDVLHDHFCRIKFGFGVLLLGMVVGALFFMLEPGIYSIVRILRQGYIGKKQYV